MKNKNLLFSRKKRVKINVFLKLKLRFIGKYLTESLQIQIVRPSLLGEAYDVDQNVAASYCS